MIKHYCDKCKKEIKEEDKFKIEIKTYKGELIKSDIDLCEKCAEELDKFNFPILDTSEITIKEELSKFDEEVKELKEAIELFTSNGLIPLDDVIEESYDVIQVVINLIYKLGLMDYMQEGLEKHIDKLKDRGWKFKRGE